MANITGTQEVDLLVGTALADVIRGLMALTASMATTETTGCSATTMTT